jgi:hypothetical protein
LPLSLTASATVTAGVAAEARASAKVAFYQEKCEARTWAFSAFVAETTGSWNQAAQRVVRRVIRAHTVRSGEDPAETAGMVWGTLSTAVARSVGRQLVRACCLGSLQPTAVLASYAVPPGSADPTAGAVGVAYD